MQESSIEQKFYDAMYKCDYLCHPKGNETVLSMVGLTFDDLQNPEIKAAFESACDRYLKCFTEFHLK